jgi:copper chaperone CopZ
MSCFHNIEDALKEADSSINAKADVRNQILTVETQLPADEVRKLIEAAGYPVNGVTKG